MHAARLMPDSDVLTFGEIPEPGVREGWALVRVEAAGLCHTDVHVMEGVQFTTRNGADYTITRPIVLGHEVAGVVVAVGSASDAGLVGTAVAAGGRANPPVTPGMHIDGGFAELCALPVGSLVPIPAGVDFETAAVATDSIKTSYVAVTRVAHVGPDDRVVVIGLGGLGLSAVQVARLRGARVFGVDINPARFDLAVQYGAEACATSIVELERHQPTAVVDFVGGATTAQALDSVSANGRVVLVGLGNGSVEVDATGLVLGRKSLIGSLGSQHTEDFVAVLDHVARGEITATLERVDFADLNDAYRRLRDGQVSGRLVTKPVRPGGAQ